MSKETLTVEVLLLDESGRPAKSKWQLPADQDLTLLDSVVQGGLALLGPITGCGILGANVIIPIEWEPTTPTTGTGTNTSMDKIAWSWSDADGNKAAFTTPAPLVGDILTNDYSVKQDDPDIAAFIAWVIDTLQSPYGKAIVAVIAAVRAWRNRKAKNT